MIVHVVSHIMCNQSKRGFNMTVQLTKKPLRPHHIKPNIDL